jgi:hypothetical protein
MHTLILEKATKLVCQSRVDNATGTKMPINDVLAVYCEDNKVDASLYEIIEIAPSKFVVEHGKHAYVDGQFVVHPDWIEPPAAETASIPVADPGAPQ